MKPIEILMFLIPHDLFQWVFLAAVVLLAGWNVYGVRKYAVPAYWEKKWHGHTPDDASDDLDADHGSLNDLSQAVASTPEKLAEIMPGLLLVIGLLGTFVGLGIALNKASEILQQAQGAGMDQAMGNLMGMMEGLGTKFKTSTWGIMGFLLFKAWATKNGFDERRLRWCVQKIKKQLDADRVQRAKIENGRAAVVVDSIKKFGSVLESEIAMNRTVLEQNQGTLDKKLEQSAQTYAAMMTLIQHTETQISEISMNRTVLERNQEILAKKLEQSTQTNVAMMTLIQYAEAQIKETQSLGTNIQGMSESVVGFIDSNKGNIVQMADAAEKMGVSAGDLKEAIGGFKHEINTVLGALEKNLGQTIKSMSEGLGKATSEMSQNLVVATEGISNAVITMSNQQQEANIKQREVLIEFKSVSDGLQENTAQTMQLIADLGEKIGSGLSAVSESRLVMNSAISGITCLSDGMKGASNGMRELVDNFNRPREYERKASEQLEALNSQTARNGQALNENVQNMVGSIKLLKDDITRGLETVQEIAKVARSLNANSENVKNVTQPVSME